ncbi:DNA repair protein RecO [Acidiferrimicrobium sp. IK]|uniref:DNA repair protein RecO n=1 Tax=Acidiferrimicrobium sp. IK TaxID=2871700 RepID=UPI0021CB9751|nr:DNA repair protein RecO [Acidiferrimicrobium sp. IK]MCU4183930.1 DNA repair protein RecO [Acidiferrimicrobium sp. IK]
MLYREEAVVLRTYKLGEADRIVVLVTEGRGKVRAVAKGVRKTKSRFGGRLEPASRVQLQLYEGRQLDTITQAESVEVYPEIRTDLTRMTDAMALLEAVDQVAQEGEPNPALYRMLVGALRTLTAAPSALLVAGFYWKLLALEGVTPMLDACVRCGAGGPGTSGSGNSGPGNGGVDGGPVELVAFDPAEGGALCRACRRGPVLTPEALDLIRAILGGDLARALTTPTGPAAAEVTDLATRALEHHLERRLRAAHMLSH